MANSSPSAYLLETIFQNLPWYPFYTCQMQTVRIGRRFSCVCWTCSAWMISTNTSTRVLTGAVQHHPGGGTFEVHRVPLSEIHSFPSNSMTLLSLSFLLSHSNRALCSWFTELSVTDLINHTHTNTHTHTEALFFVILTSATNDCSMFIGNLTIVSTNPLVIKVISILIYEVTS